MRQSAQADFVVVAAVYEV